MLRGVQPYEKNECGFEVYDILIRVRDPDTQYTLLIKFSRIITREHSTMFNVLRGFHGSPFQPLEHTQHF